MLNYWENIFFYGYLFVDGLYDLYKEFKNGSKLAILLFSFFRF